MGNEIETYLSTMFGNGLPVFNRVVTIEVELTTIPQGKTFSFPTGTVIGNDNVLVYAMQTFTAAQQTISAGGNTVIPANAASGLTITLTDTHNYSRVNQSPYANWIASLNLGYPYSLNPFRLVMDKSLVTINDPTNLTANQSVLIGLLYFTQVDLEKLLTPKYGAERAKRIVLDYYASL